MRSVTTTYRDVGDNLLTFVGYGRDEHEAQRDADRQVPWEFVPVDAYTSTPETILASLRRSPVVEREV